MEPDEIRAGVVKHLWFHHIDLGHGIITPGAGGSDWNARLEASADIYYAWGLRGRQFWTSERSTASTRSLPSGAPPPEWSPPTGGYGTTSLPAPTACPPSSSPEKP